MGGNKVGYSYRGIVAMGNCAGAPFDTSARVATASARVVFAEFQPLHMNMGTIDWEATASSQVVLWLRSATNLLPTTGK